jgi:DNA-binding transcriptional LysR family regulator
VSLNVRQVECFVVAAETGTMTGAAERLLLSQSARLARDRGPRALAPVLLESFGRRHPEVDLDFVEGPLGDIEAALLDGRCEIAITYDIDVSETIEREAL